MCGANSAFGCFVNCRDAGCHLMVVVLKHLPKIARIEIGAAERTMLDVHRRRLRRNTQRLQ